MIHTFFHRIPGHISPKVARSGRSPRIRTPARLNKVPSGKFIRVNCCYTTTAFTLSPEPWASLCCANLPENWALYAISVRRLTALHSGLPLPLVSLACGSPYTSLQPFRPRLAATPLPSANTCANKSKDLLTGFTHRGLSPH